MSVSELMKQLKLIDIGKIASELVKIPSFSFMQNQEKEIAEYIHNLFCKEGISSQLIEINPGRYNVVAKIAGKEKGKSLMLSGHLDTVPAYDMENPFSGEIRAGKLYGRGSCDMKGPIAAMISTMIALKRGNIRLNGDLYFSGLADEEEQGRGVEYLIKNGPIAEATIMGEPTDMKVAIGHKGLEWIKVTIKGKKVHGGDKENGVNAIEMASRFVNRIYEEYVPVLNSRYYPVLGAPTINIGTIYGGDQPSTVAGKCVIKLDRRFVPTETIEQVYKELRDIIEDLHSEDSQFNAEIEDVFAGEDLLPHLPFCTSEDDPLSESIKKAITLGNRKPEITVFPAWSDAGFISSNTQSHCVVMGPGDLGAAHSAHEYIKIADLEYAAFVYGVTVLEFCR